MRAICSGLMLESASDAPSKKVSAISRAELLDQLLEPLAGLGGDEVVVLQGADAAGRVVGLEVERHAPLGGDVVGDLAAALVARAVRLLDELVDGGALVLLYLVELAR